MIDYSKYSHLFNDPWNIEYHEKKTWDYMKVFLNRGCVFFDVGCQKGIFSEGVIDLLKDDCSVYGFDVLEHPSIVKLRKRFSNFKFINSAIGTGEIIACMIDYNTNTFVENQKSLSLDEFCLQNKVNNVDFIKIDVDGCEYKILEGSKNILKKYSPVLMIEMVNSEDDCNRLRIESTNQKKCKDFLKEYNYKIIGVKDDINYFFKKS
tara:strand:+ start:3033 stop:3653 length:621 start_codon:yes stop_codon:yes gene_type:complete